MIVFANKLRKIIKTARLNNDEEVSKLPHLIPHVKLMVWAFSRGISQ